MKSIFEDDVANRITDPKNAALLRAEQFQIIRANISTVALGNIFAGFLIVLTFVGKPDFVTSLIWYIGFLLIISVSMGPSVRKRAKNKSKRTNKSTYSDRTQVKLSVVLALIWVAMPFLVFGNADINQRLFIVAATIALIGVGSFFLSGVPRAAVTFSILMMGGLVLAIAVNWHPMMLNSTILLISFTMLIVSIVKENSRFLIDRMNDRIALIESNDTISDLLREHEDSGYEWLWETGPQGEIRNVSKKFTQAAGLSSEKLLNKNITNLLLGDCPDDPMRTQSCKHDIGKHISLKKPFRDAIVRYMRPDGVLRWWKLSGRPIIERDENEDKEFLGYRGVAIDITDSKNSEDKIAYMALFDSLTNLPNRASFKEQIDFSIGRTVDSDFGVALFVIDLDKFKHINDTLGHPAGDELLVMVAKRLQNRFGEAAIVARLGGDEFAVVIDGINNAAMAQEHALKIMECFEKTFVIAGRKMGISCSIGVAIAPDHGENAGDLIKNADLALYRAKTDTSSSYNLFEAGMDLMVRERRRLGQELQLAIDNDELYLLYQPLLSTATDTIIGYEALVRWKNPRCGIVNPDHFIPIAEENGMIVDIGIWVIRQACKEAASWQNSKRVAVNLSPLQFVGIQLESVVALALADSGLVPSRLELEITENSLMVNKDATLNTLRNLRQLGISIALDDFGTGYSSLSYLMSYPFDKIKIDRSFLSTNDNLGTNATLIRTIIGLAKSLGMRTTAEGVETIEHLEFLKNEGCDEIQGFLISQPVPPSAIESGEDEKSLMENAAFHQATG
ncbi:MAG: EAL domain-containing protein [Rhizobiaceae bacterium]|nr:EAL domain-containing protein [Rhizobiaceae bacterium]